MNHTHIVNSGEKVALITDVHAMYEPLLAALQDIKSRGITRIYSLGDNIGTGPNPREVLNLLREYNVISIAGNAEDYIIYGIKPYNYIMNDKSGLRKNNAIWTKEQLSNNDIKSIYLYPRSIDLIIGNEKVGLCHFANDVRFGYLYASVLNYLKLFNIASGETIDKVPTNFFKYTNTVDEYRFVLKKYDEESSIHRKDKRYTDIYFDAIKHKILGGKKITAYNSIFQGHAHFRLVDRGDTNIYTLRGLGMGWADKSSKDFNRASYVILTGCENGYKMEEVNNIEFDVESLHYNILHSKNDNPAIRKFVGLPEDKKCKVKRFL